MRNHKTLNSLSKLKRTAHNYRPKKKKTGGNITVLSFFPSPPSLSLYR